MLPFVQNFPSFSIMACLVAGIVCLILPNIAARALSLFVTAAGAVLSAGVLAHTLSMNNSFVYSMGHFPAPFGNELRAGPLEGVMALLVGVIMLLSLLSGGQELAQDVPQKKLPFYYVMCNMLMAAQLTLIYTNDLFTSYVFVDIITIAACCIIVAKPGGKSLVATVVYLIMSLVGTSLFLFAIAMLYSVTGHLAMEYLHESIAVLMQSGQYEMPLFIILGLFTVGLGIKCALFPFHGWLPQAHATATTASSSILSGIVIKCYIILLIKIYMRVFGMQTMELLRITDVLMVFGVVGLVVGSLKAMRQRNIKRMLAYSSVAQVGYIILGIGVGTAAGMAATCFHILAHAASKSMLFAAAGRLSQVSGGKKELQELRGAARKDKLAGAAFLCGVFSIIGVPMFSGFISKFVFATASLNTPFDTAVILAVMLFSTLLNAMYYLPVLMCIFSKKQSESARPGMAEALAHKLMPQLAKSDAQSTEDKNAQPAANGDAKPCDVMCSEGAPPPPRRTFAYSIAMVGFIAVNLALGLVSTPIVFAIEQGLAVFA